jgi:undecaprenyl-phosphate 4-deoxy-4-formamido-L-arabinose transferase
MVEQRGGRRSGARPSETRVRGCRLHRPVGDEDRLAFVMQRGRERVIALDATSSHKAPLDLSIVVPAYNEAANIPDLVRRTRTAVEDLGAYELIIVDDGSTDESWKVIELAAAACAEVVGVRLQRNFGQHPAVSAGFAVARGAVIVTLDADLQNPPEEIPKLVARLGPDCDVASGWRQFRRDSASRTLPSRLINFAIAKVTGVRLHDYGCMLRAYKRHVIEQVQACPEVNKTITALVSWLGASIVEVPVEHHERTAGRSRYSYWRLVRMNFDLLTGFSTGTLQLVSIAGLVVSALGLGAGVFLAVWRVLNGSGPVGLTTFFAILLFLAGAQMAAIGIVGEYVGRVYLQVQGRPYYIVSELTRVGHGAPKA